jgi:hypothetical protein
MTPRSVYNNTKRNLIFLNVGAVRRELNKKGNKKQWV